MLFSLTFFGIIISSLYLNVNQHLGMQLQVIRSGHWQRYDYGVANIFHYGTTKVPRFEPRYITVDIPFFMVYGEKDAISTVSDVEHFIDSFPKRPQVLKLSQYAHLDFLFSMTAREDIYNPLLSFLNNLSAIQQKNAF